jgi:signal transduction histidine kinase
VRSNANQLELAILNLVINARDAMPNGGAVLIDSRPTPAHSDKIDIVVKDTGEGMPPEVMSRG